ncbi:endothelin-converting enzyme 1-like isoform X1 [Dermacentor albipictus]|uniref:endothelin-converting enzyme 1-like isoform X1 n=1 Tax=Dermacentor albipictus TaxID=60249 RepID=UPI0031FD1FB0
MLPSSQHQADKSKRRRRPRSNSASSRGREFSRSSNSSGELEGTRQRPSVPTQRATADAQFDSAQARGATAATGSVAEIPVNEPPKSKRSLSFYDGVLATTPDITRPQEQQTGSTEHGMRKRGIDSTTESPFSVEPGATDGRPKQPRAVAEGDVQPPPGERHTSQPTPALESAAGARSITAHVTSSTSKKEAAETTLTAELRNAKLPPGTVKARTRSGSTVTLAVPIDAASRSGHSGKSSPQDSGSQREPSFSSFIQGLKTLSAERIAEQRARQRGSKSSIWDSEHGQRGSRIVVRVAGIPITKRQILLMAILIFIVTTVTAAIVILFRREQETPPTNPYCKTKDCLDHAWRLSDKLNSSLDPCQNFGAYVCSAWSPPKGYLEHSNSAMDDVRKSWFPLFGNILREGANIIRVGHKPLLMYATCMGDSKQYGSNVEIFWKFLNECRLSWPEEPESSDTSALDVLITLAVKWQVSLFFQLRLLRLGPAPNWRLNLDPAPLVPLVYQHHLTIKNTGGYANYWAAFFYTLKGSYDKDATINQTLIQTTMVLEGEVFRSLLFAMRPLGVQQLLVPIEKIKFYTPPLDSKEWLRALKQLELQPEMESNDQVLIADKNFFQTMAAVMASYTDTQLLSLIAWSCVQLLAPAVDLQLLKYRYDQGVILYRPYFCERFVETAYRLLVVALTSVSRFSRQERALISANFDHLVATASALVNATDWLDAENRQLAAVKLASTRLQLWPPEHFLENEALDRMYAAFPSAELPFAEYWIQSSWSAADTYRSSADIDVLSYVVNYELPYLFYDAASGAVKVAVGAIAPPLYYSDGTKAMFYGGLGFSMALNLVASMDKQGLRWHPNGTFGDSFLSHAASRAFEDRNGCLATAEEAPVVDSPTYQTRPGSRTSIFPEIPALEVAYAAYRRSISESDDDSPQGISRNLSGDQVFFMTLCYMTCSLPGAVAPHMVDCNKAVSNSEAFAQAFQCPYGSKMNPKRKCTFFTG